jgi:3-hydroxyisobutyrate dehydrogenase-like beta-hydroxyacid dehydrogenase
VDLSTTGPEMSVKVAAELSRKGVFFLEAPVSGGPPAALQGSLSVMAAGPEVAFKRVQQTLRHIGKNLFYIGEIPGHGQMMKLVNNLLAATAMAASMEAVVCGAKAGLDPRMMIDVINVSSGRNTATMDKFPKAILPRTFDFGAKTEIIYKDLQLLMQQADMLGVPMWVASQVTQVWGYAMSQGDGPKDFTNLIKHMEKWAGIEVKG